MCAEKEKQWEEGNYGSRYVMFSSFVWCLSDCHFPSSLSIYLLLLLCFSWILLYTYFITHILFLFLVIKKQPLAVHCELWFALDMASLINSPSAQRKTNPSPAKQTPKRHALSTSSLAQNETLTNPLGSPRTPMWEKKCVCVWFQWGVDDPNSNLLIIVYIYIYIYIYIAQNIHRIHIFLSNVSLK